VIKLPITGKQLKPCPFCGCEKLYLFEDHVYSFAYKYTDYIIIECGRCGATIKRPTVIGVKRAWDKRELEGKAFVDGYKQGVNFFK